MRDDVLGFLDGRGIERADLVGHSMGVRDCRLVTVEDAGHRVHSVKPDEFWSAVSPFLCTEPVP